MRKYLKFGFIVSFAYLVLYPFASPKGVPFTNFEVVTMVTAGVIASITGTSLLLVKIIIMWVRIAAGR